MPDSATEPGVLLIGAGAVGSLLCASLLRSSAGVQWLVRSPQRRSEAAQLRMVCDGAVLELPLERLRIIVTSGVKEIRRYDWDLSAIKQEWRLTLTMAKPSLCAAARENIQSGFE